MPSTELYIDMALVRCGALFNSYKSWTHAHYDDAKGGTTIKRNKFIANASNASWKCQHVPPYTVQLNIQ